MTHVPPVPEGNTSPYPIQEPPHVHVETATADEAEDAPASEPIALTGEAKTMLGIGAALGVGAIAAVTALLFSRRPAPKPAARKPAARKTAAKKRAPAKKAA
jgi:hypothetical protein